MQLTNTFTLLLITLILSACTVAPVRHIPSPYNSTEYPDSCDQSPKKLVVFFDGTANDEGSYTNISKLRNLITLQDKQNIRTIYIPGVGTSTRIIGAGFGWGTADDVKQGYKFLTKNHTWASANEIYLFGFSRGSWSARILAGLVQVAGIPDLSGYSESFSDKLIDDIYRAYKGDIPINVRRARVKQAFNENKHISYKPASVNLRFVGIWDTVEALGWPDFKENNEGPNRRYLEQLCNVETIAHAISLDDDRARIFTPIFITAAETQKQCGYFLATDPAPTGQRQVEILGEVNAGDSRKIQQVFFAGAHSDVGGGYADTEIDGISLNWMIDQVKTYQLLPKNSKVYADPFDKTNDPEAWPWGPVYHRLNRNLSLYDALLDDQFTVHKSVIDRLACVPVDWHETQWQSRKNHFRHCFTKVNGILEFQPLHPKCHLKTTYEPGYKAPGCPYSAPQVLSEKPQTLEVKIHAKKKQNRTGILLSKNKRYRITISKVDSWRDDGLCADPFNGRDVLKPLGPADGIDKGCKIGDNSFLMKHAMNYFRTFNFEPDANYMELLGTIVSTQPKTNYIPKHGKPFRRHRPSAASKLIRLGKIATEGKPSRLEPQQGEFFTPEKDGELIVFANEPKISDMFYDNNSGTLLLSVELVPTLVNE